MANQADIDRAKRGTEAWNAWASRLADSGQPGPVDFSGESMAGLNFSEFRFPGEFNFEGSTFPAGVSFRDCIFGGVADFSRAEFEGAVDFSRAKFTQFSKFTDVTFKKDARFRRTEFGNDAWFTASIFSECAIFGDSKFARAIWFEDVRFMSATEFGGMTAQTAETSFEGAKFSQVPDFRFTTFGAPPNLHALEVDFGISYSARGIEGWLGRAGGLTDVAAIRWLKKIAADAKDHESELRFFALELKAKRFHETKGFWPIALNVAYEWLSDFGRSIGRPLSWLAGSIVAAAISILVQHADKLPRYQDPAIVVTVGKILAVSATNAVALVGGEKLEARQEALKNVFCPTSEPECGKNLTLTLAGHWLVYLQSAFSLLLFFLIGLALRNRFRIGGGG